MSTVEDFESAPAGATATRADGSRIMKTDNGGQQWLIQDGFYVGAREMAEQGCTLDRPAPASAREALDTAWELAHEVKPGQVIPKGTRYLEDYGYGMKESTAQFDIEISFHTVPEFRTLEPLPDPEPDWLDAPAVIATCGYCETKALHGPLEDRSCWECTECQIATTWRALTDVTPLYPRGIEA